LQEFPGLPVKGQKILFGEQFGDALLLSHEGLSWAENHTASNEAIQTRSTKFDIRNKFKYHNVQNRAPVVQGFGHQNLDHGLLFRVPPAPPQRQREGECFGFRI
jgi:hypothetical protein